MFVCLFWLISLVLVGLSQAALVYDNEAAFLADTRAGYYREDFEGLDVGVLSDPANFSSLGFSYAVTVGNGNPGLYVINTPGLSKGLSIDSPANRALVVSFTSANVTAVGGCFYMTDYNGDLATGSFTVSLNDGTLVNLASPSSAPAPFRGFTTTGGQLITSLTISPPAAGGYFPTFDNFIVGTAVPEPAVSGTIVGLACLALGLRRMHLPKC